MWWFEALLMSNEPKKMCLGPKALFSLSSQLMQLYETYATILQLMQLMQLYYNNFVCNYTQLCNYATCNL